MSKPTVIVVMDYFLPGFKAGGPLRSITHLIDRLSPDFDFRIVTRDRDLGDEAPYTDVPLGAWTEHAGYRVHYVPLERITPRGLAAVLDDVDADLIYLNSFFSPFTRSVMRLRRRTGDRSTPVLIAPRGEFAPNALALGRVKKLLYMKVARLIGLYRDVGWHCSSEHEEADVRRFSDGPTFVAPNLPPSPASLPEPGPPAPKRAGELRVTLISRLARIKNVDFALRCLARVRGDVTFDIYGTIEDRAYYEEWRAEMERLPGHVQARYCGAIPHDRVAPTLATYHGFFFPSRNENFGHSVLEAMLAGLPVLISDGTFWRGLREAGAGADLTLDRPERFVEELQRWTDMDGAAFARLSAGARAHALAYLADPGPVDTNRRMFRTMAGRSASTAGSAA